MNHHAAMMIAATLAALSCSPAAAAAATTYFVSPEGSDSAAGTSAAAPWLSLSIASRKLGPGDTLLLQRGGRWLEEALVSSAAQLTVGACERTPPP